MKPNYTASSFYNLRPVENYSKAGVSDYQKGNNVFDDTQSLKKLENINKDLEKVLPNQSKNKIFHEKLPTRIPTASQLKFRQEGEYGRTSYSKSKLTSYNSTRGFQAKRRKNMNKFDRKGINSANIKNFSKVKGKIVNLYFRNKKKQIKIFSACATNRR